MENTFDRPTQVVFADPDNADCWIVGIAYKDEIICGCCGGIFDIGDVIDCARENGIEEAIYPYDSWEDISFAITGGKLPQNCPIQLEETPEEEVLSID